MAIDQGRCGNPLLSIGQFSRFLLIVTACVLKVSWAHAALPLPSERLEGTVITPALRVAAFVKEPHGGTLLLEVGEDLHGWQIQSIYPCEAILRSSDGSTLIKTLTGTTIPVKKSLLQQWAPAKFHYEY